MGAQMQNQTHFFNSKDSSRKLFYQTFQNNVGTPKAKLLITHGQGEHSEAYRDLATSLCANLPLHITAWDLVGHGKSSGQRGYVGDISWLSEDFAKIVHLTQEEQPQLPLFLLSHSLGGLVHLYAEHEDLFKPNDIAGAVLSNPCLALNFTPPKWKTIGAEVLTKLAPRVTLGNELSASQMSSDKAYLEVFKNDPLRHQSISPRFYLGMLDMMERLSHRKTSHPTLTMLSPNDSVCAPVKAESYLKDSSQILFFENSRHELLNDIEKETATQAIKEFINDKI